MGGDAGGDFLGGVFKGFSCPQILHFNSAFDADVWGFYGDSLGGVADIEESEVLVLVVRHIGDPGDFSVIGAE